MPFRFREADGTVEAGLRRIACGQIDAALAAIRSGEMASERVVHEVRRRCKALRALIRLVRPVFPQFEKENAAFREIGKSLAWSRDSKVLLDTLEALVADKEDAFDPRMVRLLRKRFAQPPDKARPLRQTLGKCEERLVAARVRAGSWTLTADSWQAIGEGFARTLKRARAAMKDAARTNDPACSHEWRKQVKDHGYHMRLLRDLAPAPAEARAKQAARVGDLLGERHDLDLFIDLLAAQPPRSSDAATLERLTAIARKRAARLDARAHKLGKQLFGDRPRKIVGKWAERWADRARHDEMA